MGNTIECSILTEILPCYILLLSIGCGVKQGSHMFPWGGKYSKRHDPSYFFQLIPVYLAEMFKVKKMDPVTWEYLKNDIVVTNSTIVFVNLLDSQGLKQQIKELKKYCALPGIVQIEETFDRFVTTAPRLSSMVERFLTTNPKVQWKSVNEVCHQFYGNMG